MYIKQVIIQGFRSYRDQTVIEPFSPRHNVVVGRNGSGKSNFFFAIQFVLSDEFSHLRPEQRQALLHEGTGQRVLTAFVEVIFDNSDARIPIDKDEIVLRRVIGSKKDQYFLDKKMVTKTDVMNLLESAGFSRSNPYYIVKQGKITQLATAPDSMRLKLLREVAGTKVYDERKEESKNILKDSESRREKIEDLLKYIDERLHTLETEKEELKEYQKWDKMRRALEYTIYDRELKDAKRKLDELENKREESSNNASKFHKKLEDIKDKIQELQTKLRECKQVIEQFSDEREQLNSDQAVNIKKRTKLELVVQDLSSEVDGDKLGKIRAAEDLKKLNQTIKEKQKQLEEICPKYDEYKVRENDLTIQLQLAEQKRKELYAKQGRGNQFASRDDRDKWIKNELKIIEKAIVDKQEQIKKLEQGVKVDEQKEQALTERREGMSGQMESYKKNNEHYEESQYNLKKQISELQSERSEQQRKETSLQQQIAALKEDLHKKTQSLRSITGKSILNGIDSINKVLREMAKSKQNEHVIKGYHHTLINNLTCDKKFYVAVEVTAGNRLFHHIVETADVGTKLLREMNRLQLPGEVTFMPLDKLDSRPVAPPESDDAVPMIEQLSYDAKFGGAMRHVFGRTLICKNMDVATYLSRTQNFDCITLDGDQVSRRGALTGGYYDRKKSRLDIQKTKLEQERELTDKEAECAELRAKLNQIEQKINQCLSDQQRLETKANKMRDTFERSRSDVRLLKEEHAAIVKSKEAKQERLHSLGPSLDSMRTSQNSLQNELGTDLLAQLSVEEQREVDALSDQIKQLSKESKQVFSERMRIEGEKNKLDSILQNNLYRRKRELEEAMEEKALENRKDKLDHSTNELKLINDSISKQTSKISDLDEQLLKLRKEKKVFQNDLDDFMAKEKELADKIDTDQKDVNKLASKQEMLVKKKDDAVQKIRDLGSLPADAFDKYKDRTVKQLFKQLDECNRELKNYDHVNKKALDQYVSFSDQKEKLMKRKEELDRAFRSIMELMDHLEHRKHEAIQLTFKQVSKNFSEVFKYLVPNGCAELLMKKASSGEDDEGGDEDEGPTTSKKKGKGAASIVEQFSGVGIKVSFTGKRGEMRDMRQLSGGQKSLVALTLIFAIQKCDPAPFYLFDEIDQALDQQHRRSVAGMIHELSGDAQFITTTFRPELLEHADKFYGVKFRNKVSHIDAVTKEEADDFVEDDDRHA